jgi:hypothetical protein
MQQHIHTIVKHFFQKDSLQEVPEQTLQQFTEEHPYSSVGHWLLAKKLHQSAPERYESQASRAATWFNNPLWLNWTLEDKERTPETLIIPSLPKEPVTAPKEAVIEAPQPEAIYTPEPIQEEAIVTAANPDIIDDTDTETEIMIPGVSEPISLLEEPVAAPAAPVEEVAAPVEAVAEVPVQQIVTEEEGTPPAPADEQPAPLVAAAGEYKPVTVNTEEPLFEPYHTIDYFASLGIKLRQEDLKDKLGIQLKSFTEWLRSMKRIAPTSAEAQANAFDETLQQSIQEIAGHSIEGKEVVTEAMADVWLKQGNVQKAIAIYEKLSLLNPVKSAYFAAQIEKLKAS